MTPTTSALSIANGFINSKNLSTSNSMPHILYKHSETTTNFLETNNNFLNRKRKYSRKNNINSNTNDNTNLITENLMNNSIETANSENEYSDEDDEEQCRQITKSQSNSPSIDEDRRAHHNELERRRRDHIKDHFSTLKNAIPLLEGEKSSRALILKRAVDYIKILQKQIQEYKLEIKEVKQTAEAMSLAKHTATAAAVAAAAFNSSKSLNNFNATTSNNNNNNSTTTSLNPFNSLATHLNNTNIANLSLQQAQNTSITTNTRPFYSNNQIIFDGTNDNEKNNIIPYLFNTTTQAQQASSNANLPTTFNFNNNSPPENLFINNNSSRPTEPIAFINSKNNISNAFNSNQASTSWDLNSTLLNSFSNNANNPTNNNTFISNNKNINNGSLSAPPNLFSTNSIPSSNNLNDLLNSLLIQQQNHQQQQQQLFAQLNLKPQQQQQIISKENQQNLPQQKNFLNLEQQQKVAATTTNFNNNNLLLPITLTTTPNNNKNNTNNEGVIFS